MKTPERWLMCFCAVAIALAVARQVGGALLNQVSSPEAVMIWVVLGFPLVLGAVTALIVLLWAATRLSS